MPEEFDRMVEHVKESIRKQFPNKTEKEVSSSAYGIAKITWKEKYGTNLLK